MNPHAKAFFKGLRDALLIGLILTAAIFSNRLRGDSTKEIAASTQPTSSFHTSQNP